MRLGKSMTRNNKYFQKGGGRSIISNIIEAIEGTIPSLKGKLPDTDTVLSYIPTKSQVVDYGFDYGKKQIKSKIKGDFRDLKFSQPESVSVDNISNQSSDAQNYLREGIRGLSNVASKRWAKESAKISTSINSASQINSQDAKNFISIAGGKIGNVTAKQIDKVFDSNAVIGLMATSKTVNDLKNKIQAGIVLNNISKEKSYKKIVSAQSRNVGIE